VGTAEYSMAGEVVLVTGGRRGIGRAVALAFAKAGADVAICDVVREDGELQAVAAEIEKLGRRALAIYADTSKKGDVENMVQRVMDEFGRIDVLVNNAGIVIYSSLLDLPESDWDKLMNINVKGYFLCAQAVARRMVAQRAGTIINVASQFSFKVTPRMGLYAVAKAGVAMLTRAFAQELGTHGIRVNAVAPGLVRSEFSRESWSNPQFMEKFEPSLPLGRIGEIEDIVGVIMFLASRSSQYVTGHAILADGGALA
jgi:NAD(P)-dependent dehydrogenase (short-subunit alcohol dehydrogenase family)